MDPRAIPYTGQGVQYSLSYANSTARTGATGLIAADVGRIARQVDTGAFYMLTDESPVTWSAIGGGAANAIEQGLHSIWIPASGFSGWSDANAAVSATVDAGSAVYPAFEFSLSAQQYVSFPIRMPKSWNAGTITASIEYAYKETTATNFKVRHSVSIEAIEADGSLNPAFGGAGTSIDHDITSDKFLKRLVTPTSSAITVQGTPTGGDLLLFVVSRVGSDATYDTLAKNTFIIGVNIFYTVNAATDA